MNSVNEYPKIFLIGFMGCGKSYVGHRLAESIGFNFIDLDSVIEAKASKKISQIFQEFGEQHFRTLERNALETLPDNQNLIIATGGGTPCFFQNMQYMNEKGLTIYLKTPVEILVKRLLNESSKRPLIAGFDKAELPVFISEKLKERNKFYEQAHIIYDTQQESNSILKDLEVFFSRIKRP